MYLDVRLKYRTTKRHQAVFQLLHRRYIFSKIGVKCVQTAVRFRCTGTHTYSSCTCSGVRQPGDAVTGERLDVVAVGVLQQVDQQLDAGGRRDGLLLVGDDARQHHHLPTGIG